MTLKPQRGWLKSSAKTNQPAYRRLSKMLTEQQRSEVRPRLFALQIIAISMIFGAIVFAGMVASMADWSLIYEPIKMLNTIGIGTAVVMFIIAFLAPSMIPPVPVNVGKAPVDPDPAQDAKAIKGIIASLSTETVIRFAILEGAIFLNVMVFMLEPRVATIVVIGIAVFLMLASMPFPFRSMTKLNHRFENWRSFLG